MCIPNVEYQYINPNTQVSLSSMCVSNCQPVQKIGWSIYQGTRLPSSNITQWTLYNKLATLQDIWFFGRQSREEGTRSTLRLLGVNTSHFTATKDLFIDSSNVVYWRFEVVYSSASQSSSSALNFIVNQPPRSGSCSVSPLSGTTSTLFTLACSNWFDEDGVKDYSFYGNISTNNQRLIDCSSSLE